MARTCRGTGRLKSFSQSAAPDGVRRACGADQDEQSAEKPKRQLGELIETSLLVEQTSLWRRRKSVRQEMKQVTRKDRGER